MEGVTDATLATLAADVSQRTMALQRRDAAMLVVAGLAAHPPSYPALLATPHLVDRLLVTARTTVGYYETPALAMQALRSMAAHGDAGVTRALQAAGLAGPAVDGGAAKRRALDQGGSAVPRVGFAPLTAIPPAV